MSGKLDRVFKDVNRRFGKTQAQRLEKAADETNLELWNPKNLTDQFGYTRDPISGSKRQNSGLFMNMPPESFEDFARPLMNESVVPYPRWENVPKGRRPLEADQTLEAYLDQLRGYTAKRGIDSPMELFALPPRAGPGEIKQHEGRHTFRMLGQSGEGAGLMRFNPLNSGELTGEADEVIERLMRNYFPKGQDTRYTPEPERFVSPRGALSFPTGAFGEGGDVQGYKNKGRVIEGVKNLSKSLGVSAEEAERLVREHTMRTGNEALIYGHRGMPASELRNLEPGFNIGVKIPQDYSRFVDTAPDKPWFTTHSHPLDSISPSTGDLQVWSRPATNEYGRAASTLFPYMDMNIAAAPSKSALNIGRVSSGDYDPIKNMQTVLGFKKRMENRWGDPLANADMMAKYDDFLRAQGLHPEALPTGVPDPTGKHALHTPESLPRSMDAGHLLGQMADLGIPIKVDTASTLPGTDASLLDVWSELGKMFKSRGETPFAEGGEVQHFSGKGDQLVAKLKGALSAKHNIQGQEAARVNANLDKVHNQYGDDAVKRLIKAQDQGANLSYYTPEALGSTIDPTTRNLITTIDPLKFQNFAFQIDPKELAKKPYTMAREAMLAGKNRDIDQVLEHYASIARAGQWDEVPQLHFGMTPETARLGWGQPPTSQAYPPTTFHEGRHRMMTMAGPMADIRSLLSVRPDHHDSYLFAGAPTDAAERRMFKRKLEEEGTGRVVPQHWAGDPLEERMLSEVQLPRLPETWAEGGVIQKFGAGDVVKKAKALKGALSKTERAIIRENEMNDAMLQFGLPDPKLQTVGDPRRLAYPGIYKDPDVIATEALEKLIPDRGADNPLSILFGESRASLDEMGRARNPNEGVAPMFRPKKATGNALTEQIQTPENTQRLIDIIGESLQHPELAQTATWYEMAPLWKRMTELGISPEEQQMFNMRMGIMSPRAAPDAEIARGTAAHMLFNKGRSNEFGSMLGIPEKDRPFNPRFPEDLIGAPGALSHAGHTKSLAKLNEAGQLITEANKVPHYVAATDPIAPFAGHPVADSHFARGLGYGDIRRMKTPEDIVSNLTNPEFWDTVPWWKKISDEFGMTPRDTQALQWNVLGPQTGVRATGAPKLEILADQIMKASKRLNVAPDVARDMVLRGEAGAFEEGGPVQHFDEGGRSFPRTKKVVGAISEALNDSLGGAYQKYKHNPLEFMIGSPANAIKQLFTDPMKYIEDHDAGLRSRFGVPGTALDALNMVAPLMVAHPGAQNVAMAAPALLSPEAWSMAGDAAQGFGKDVREYLGFADGGPIPGMNEEFDEPMDFVKRIIPGATDMWGTTPNQGVKTPEPPKLSFLPPPQQPQGGGGGSPLDAIFSMGMKLAPMIMSGGAAAPAMMGSGMTFAEGGSVDDDMLAYHTMFYGDGGSVPGFSMGGDMGSMSDMLSGGSSAIPYASTIPAAADLGMAIATPGEDQASNIGKGIGETVGSVIPIPFMGKILGQLGAGVGAWIGGKSFEEGMGKLTEGSPMGMFFADGGMVPGMPMGDPMQDPSMGMMPGPMMPGPMMGMPMPDPNAYTPPFANPAPQGVLSNMADSGLPTQGPAAMAFSASPGGVGALSGGMGGFRRGGYV